MNIEKNFAGKPCKKIYKAMDINGNAVYKIIWPDGSSTIERGYNAIINPISNYDKFYKSLSSLYRAK